MAGPPAPLSVLSFVSGYTHRDEIHCRSCWGFCQISVRHITSNGLSFTRIWNSSKCLERHWTLRRAILKLGLLSAECNHPGFGWISPDKRAKVASEQICSNWQNLTGFKVNGIVGSDFVPREDISDAVMVGCGSFFATNNELEFTFRSWVVSLVANPVSRM